MTTAPPSPQRMLRKPAPIAQPVHSPNSNHSPASVSPPVTAATAMQRGSNQHPQPIGGASENHSSAAATTAAAPSETDYQRLLRETAAARAHRTQQDKGSASSSKSNSPKKEEQKSPESEQPLSFAQLREQLQQRPPPAFAPPPVAAAPVARSMPVASAPEMPAARSTVPRASAAFDAPARQALEVPSRYNADEALARRLQAEEEARSRAEQVISPAERTRRQLAAEADARMARELQAAEVVESQRGHPARNAESDADAELARTLQAEESDGRGVDSPNSNLSHHSHHSRGASRDNDEDDGVILLPSDVADAEEQNRRDLDEVHRRHQEAHRRAQLQNSAEQLAGGGSAAHPARSREQIIRRLHEMQGSYPGLGGQRPATFRFRPDGRLVVGWDDEDDGAAGSGGAGEVGNAQRRAAGSDEVNLGAEEEAAQRAAFAQFEREQAARQARQGGAAASASSSAAAADHEEEKEGGSGGGFWGTLGGMLHRHLRNANQGIPFPLSVMVEPSDLQGFGRRSELSGGGPGIRWQWSRSFGDGAGGDRAGGLRGRQAELDVDSMDYEQLLRLEDALGSVKPRVKSATREQLDQLPVQAFHKPSAAAASSSSSSSAAAPSAAAAAAANSEGSECSICCCEFEEGDAVKTLPCFHRFHAAEIDKWLSTNELCPICRVPVGGSEAPSNS